jgi:hypothetical protein
MDEAQQIAVDIADVERHGLRPATQRDTTVGVGEQQHGRAGGVGGVAGFQLISQHIDRPQRAHRSVLGRVVSPVHAGGAAGEAAAAQFVVLKPVQIGVHPPGCGAFSQVDEGFHRGSRGRSGEKTESDVTFVAPL